MSSGFVSGGTTDAPIEHSDEWLAAQAEIDASRARKAAEAQQSSGRSLYEVLEANKAAKQEAFEEANRLKNQFRALDEDEVEFLDSVLEKTRAEEERVRRETAEGLELFRRQQEEADRKARAASSVAGGEQRPDEVLAAAVEEEQWIAAGRKRKRAKEKEGLKGVKIRKSSSSTLETAVAASPPAKEQQAEEAKPASVSPDDQADLKSKTSSPAPVSKASPAAPKAGLGLVDYGSDEDDD